MFHQTVDAARNPRRALALVYAGLLGLAAIIALVEPRGDWFYPKCLFHSWTGLHCPGCGATRAVHQALNGRFLDAARMNLLLALAAPWLIYEVLSDLVYLSRGKPLPTRRMRRWEGWAVLAVVLLFWIARNIPVEPFRRLAP